MKEVVQQTSLCEVIESNLYAICSTRQVVLRNYYKYLLNISLFDENYKETTITILNNCK